MLVVILRVHRYAHGSSPNYCARESASSAIRFWSSCHLEHVMYVKSMYQML